MRGSYRPDLGELPDNDNEPDEPRLAPRPGSAICWGRHPTDLGRLRGFLPAIPSVTLFLIDICDDKPHRGTMRGAFIPDDEDGTDLNERALVVTLKHRAEAYLREWDEARAKQSPNAPRSATGANNTGDRNHE